MNEEEEREAEEDAIADALALARAMEIDCAIGGTIDGGPQDTPAAALPASAPTFAQGDGHPYDRLTPECALDALETIGYRCDGRLLALNSYENRVFLIGLEDGSQCVAKFYRPDRWTDAQIVEEHRFVDALHAAEIPAVPARIDGSGASLHRHAGFRFATFERRGGRAPELDQGDTRQWLGRFIGRIHTVGAATAYVERPALDIATFGYEPRDWLLRHGMIPAPLAGKWSLVVDEALAAVAACDADAGASRLLRLHGDCHLGNVLWTDGPHFVDFDDSRMGPALQDLWMLLSGSRDEMTHQLADLLEGYAQFASFDMRELRRLEALRTLRMIHYCVWIARRWDDPAFPAAFSFFGSERYWQDQIAALHEQIDAMSQPPLAP